MNSLTSNLKFIASVLCFSLLLITLPSNRAAAASKPGSVVIVTGSGAASAAPDTANISLTISTSAEETTAASGENAAITDKVRTAVRELGISKSDIKTSNYNCFPVYDNDNSISGYRVSNTLQVTVRNFSVINQVIDNSLAAGATQISGLYFSLSDTSKLRSIAIQAAIADAKEKAEIIASSLGKTITGIDTITENSSDSPRRYSNAMLLKAAASADTQIDGGELDYNATVTIHYFIN